MTATDFIAERERLEAVRVAVTRGLSGRDTPFLLDAEPTSRYCVGVLTPPADDPDQLRAQRRARRKPDALGFAARVSADGGIIEGTISISLALYHRVVPTPEEQCLALDEEAMAGKVRVKPKYHRVEVRIPDLPFMLTIPTTEGTTSFSLVGPNAAISDVLHTVTQAMASDPTCWPGDDEIKVPRTDLTDPARFDAAFPKKPPVLPQWKAVLEGRLSLFIQNRSEAGTVHKSELFDVQVQMRLKQGRFEPEPFVAAALDYRYHTESWGRGVNSVLEIAEDGRFARTETLPLFEQPRTRSAAPEASCSTSRLAGAETFVALAEVEADLVRYADEWDSANHAFMGQPSGPKRLVDAEQFRAEIDRFRLGIQALAADDRLLHAFRYANEAAALRKLESWRLFQLVFVVTMLPSLLAREQPNDPDLRAELDRVDVVWFPTGSGKTEASFAAILTAMFYDRLRGKLRGTTAWLRYPLRMLSIQQLQRLTDFVVAADSVRQDKLGDRKGDPFLVGYYVGSENTPNQLTTFGKGEQPITRYKRDADQNGGDASDLRVLQHCPYCRAVKPKVEVRDDPTELRIFHRCHQCGRVAPIVISDSEIYRYAPTVIVGTVDRLARAGQTDLFSHLFGQFDAQCPQHGYSSFGRCVEEAVCSIKAGKFIPVPPVYDPTPALLLQDELHLLKESLGTYDAHFEGVVDAIAERLGTGLPPKRFAATATIEGYPRHIKELYGREGRRFPEKGRGEHDSAYAMLDHEFPVRRIYVGVLPFGVDSDEVAARIAEIADEVAGAYWEHPACYPALASRYDLSLIYVNQKNTAGNVGARLTSRMQVRSLTGDRSLDEVREAIDQIETDAQKPYSERLKTLIATSLISHGVDLSRLNVMAFVGFPGRAADYIQSSSRVGRDNTGLVFTIFDPVDNLNRSTYLHFHEYHERLYQLVQPVPINRFSEASVARTFSGVYAALLLNLVAHTKSFKKSLIRGSEALRAYERGALTDDEMIQLVTLSYEVEHHGLPTEVVERLKALLGKKVRNARQQIEANEDWATAKRLRPPPVSSLRDVEDQIEFGVSFSARAELDKLRGY